MDAQQIINGLAAQLVERAAERDQARQQLAVEVGKMQTTISELQAQIDAAKPSRSARKTPKRT